MMKYVQNRKLYICFMNMNKMKFKAKGKIKKVRK